VLDVRKPPPTVRRTPRELRSAIAEVVAERARLRLPLALPADHLATVLIALTKGMAVEAPADPHGVPKDLHGQVLDLLLG
jgi:hypothetical protein